MSSSWEKQHDTGKRTVLLTGGIVVCVLALIFIINNIDLLSGSKNSQHRAAARGASSESKTAFETGDKYANRNDDRTTASHDAGTKNEKENLKPTKTKPAAQDKFKEQKQLEKTVAAQHMSPKSQNTSLKKEVAAATNQKNSGKQQVTEEQSIETSDASLNPSLDEILQKKNGLVVPLENIQCNLSGTDKFYVSVSLNVQCRGTKLQKELLLKREDLKLVVKRVMRKKNLSNVFVENLRDELKKEMNKILKSGTLDDLEFVDFKPVSY
ncbi:MAG: hypothetical protein JW795_20640 [Chitinivibrionales bacterium]|nr:hypothetical protein [Chitinivibrionales bacterium]